MFIKNAVVEIFDVKAKSLVCLVGLDVTDDGFFPRYMITSSIKSFQNVNSRITPTKGLKFHADILIQKDNQYRTWLVFKSFNREIR